MRIGVNAVPLRVWGGGARYCFTNLLQAMLARDDGHEYVIFAHFLGLPVVNELLHVHRHLCPERKARIVEIADEHSVFHHAGEFDVYFSPLNNLQPRIYDRPTVAILHDIQEQFFPQFFSKGDLEARREIYPEICRAATVLVTISEFCRQSIVEKFDIDPAKIEVVYNAPQQSLVGRSPDDRGVWRERPLPDRFVFYPANFYPHKNHVTLLDALARLRSAGSTHLPHAVFTGFEVAGGTPIHEEIARRGLQDLVHVFPKVDEDGLRYLYMHAIALVMPTLFEGFGMPAVEAMACGCPFIAADVPALREIAGEAAEYFPPSDAVRAAQLIERFAATDMRRDPMVERAHRRAADFSWEKSAGRIVDILEDAPRRFLGFAPHRNARSAEEPPRIALLITTQQADVGVLDALKSLWRTGYPGLHVEVVARDLPLTPPCRRLLDDVPVPHVLIENGVTDLALLRDLAARSKADLAGQVLTGNGLTSTGLHSAAQAVREIPEALVFLGESWVVNAHSAVIGAARLALRGNQWWTLEGGIVYPEMIFFRPEALDQAARLPFTARWRWELVKQARVDGRLCLLRRSLGISRGDMPFVSRLRASLDSGIAGPPLPLGRRMLHRVEPALRVLSKALPGRLRRSGKRLWAHVKSG